MTILNDLEPIDDIEGILGIGTRAAAPPTGVPPLSRQGGRAPSRVLSRCRRLTILARKSTFCSY